MSLPEFKLGSLDPESVHFTTIPVSQAVLPNTLLASDEWCRGSVILVLSHQSYVEFFQTLYFIANLPLRFLILESGT